ncbi:MAG: hypothetical protein ACD_39C00194G0003, partial [uncultured bacterium]
MKTDYRTLFAIKRLWPVFAMLLFIVGCSSGGGMLGSRVDFAATDAAT